MDINNRYVVVRFHLFSEPDYYIGRGRWTCVARKARSYSKSYLPRLIRTLPSCTEYFVFPASSVL